MFKNTDSASKAVIAVLFALLVAQSIGVYKLRNAPPKVVAEVVEVEAKVCSQDGITCQFSPTLTAMESDNTPVYMCMEGTD